MHLQEQMSLQPSILKRPKQLQKHRMPSAENPTGVANVASTTCLAPASHKATSKHQIEAQRASQKRAEKKLAGNGTQQSNTQKWLSKLSGAPETTASSKPSGGSRDSQRALEASWAILETASISVRDLAPGCSLSGIRGFSSYFELFASDCRH